MTMATDNNQLIPAAKETSMAAAVAGVAVVVAAAVVAAEMVEATAWRGQRLKAEAIVVETVDAKPWLRFICCWPVAVQREESLL